MTKVVVKRERVKLNVGLHCPSLNNDMISLEEWYLIDIQTYINGYVGGWVGLFSSAHVGLIRKGNGNWMQDINMVCPFTVMYFCERTDQAVNVLSRL